MKADFADKFYCPAPDCTSMQLNLEASSTRTLLYSNGPVEEVYRGSLHCPICGRVYPIDGYVPSFEQLFSPELLQEADYWGKWYGFMWDHAYLGFFDLKAPRAPLITEGIEVLDPSSLAGKESPGSHTLLAEHPLIKGAKLVLDIGCGTGWTTLYFARRGHNMVAFDPSASNMRLAKRYAISQGEYIEYIGAALGSLSFKPDTFDAAIALHSIHHVPRLREEMKRVRRWLKEGAAIGVDEHIGNSAFLSAMAAEMHAWAQRDVYPRMRTLSTEILSGLPVAKHSPLEDVGSEEVIEAILDNFALDSFSSRYVSLDYFSFIYYLSRELDQLLALGPDKWLIEHPDAVPFAKLDVRAYFYSGDVLSRLYSLMQQAFPESAEYITLVGRKTSAHALSRAGAEQNAALQARGTTPLDDKRGPVSTLLKAENWRLRDQLAATGGELAATQNEASRMEALVQSLRDDLQTLAGQSSAAAAEASSLHSEIGRLAGIIEVKNNHIIKLEALIKGQEALLRAGTLEKLRRRILNNTYTRKVWELLGRANASK